MSTDNSNLARIPSAFQTAASFVSGLPKVPCTDLPDNECSICREDFDASQATDDGEIPVRLPCGHIFGEKCLLAFLSIGTTRHSCPMCRGKLPPLADHASRRSEEYASFLSWIALHYRHLGAALDRQYAVLKAIHQANFYLTAMSNCYNPQDGRLDAVDQRYIALMYQIAGLDPQSPTSWRTLEAIQEELDEVMQQVESHIQRPIPHLRPWVGRKISLTNFILETETPLLESDLEEGESSLEDGEIPQDGLLEIIHGTTGSPGGPIPENAPIDSSSFPPEIREALQADFEGMPTAEIWDTLRSRRFALDLPCRFLHATESELLEKLASWLYVSDEVIAEYSSDTAFRERGPRREWHWQMNAAGNTREYAGEWY